MDLFATLREYIESETEGAPQDYAICSDLNMYVQCEVNPTSYIYMLDIEE